MPLPWPAAISSFSRLAPRLPSSSFLKSGIKLVPKASMEDGEALLPLRRKLASSRICLVSGFSTELLEVRSEAPSFHVLVVPGNPGIALFYKEFIEALYQLFDGNASITAISHISHSRKDWEHGRRFSLQEQIDHKLDFINQELRISEIPLILVGHSIGAYICLEIFKRHPNQVMFVVGLYPFLALNRDSLTQTIIRIIAGSTFLNVSASYLLSLLGSFPAQFLRTLVRKLLGKSWSTTAVDAVCDNILQYHTMRNVLYMVLTEFAEFTEEPDWEFMRDKKNQIALLFGTDDHWAPLSFFKLVSEKVPDLDLSIEREGHSHAFSCTEAGSLWVARHVAALISGKLKIQLNANSQM
ncbi:Lipid droplet-associated hydrolase protein [Dioscorea alata]|uniref:Lipid droplet-associated hydrolase protein n=1 Tax=Dioscorea alata TaxID=55571 RepID=A0ACB7VCK7_DIOAL|nr:Lipid droplet-associated hydrolase protein [Dioscorea alata]